jgi:hypothetical protein
MYISVPDSSIRCNSIQINGQETQCAEWIMSPQSQISLCRSNGGAAATSRAELYPGSFRAPASSTDAAQSHVFTHVRVYAMYATCYPNHADGRIKETCRDCTRHRLLRYARVRSLSLSRSNLFALCLCFMAKTLKRYAVGYADAFRDIERCLVRD